MSKQIAELIRDGEITPEVAKFEKARRSMKASFHSFFMATAPKQPYVYGRHTDALITKLDQAVKSVEEGKSVYMVVNMPPRHGKSDIASRRFPAWVLCRQPSWELILSSYNSELATDMAVDVKRCFRGVGRLFDISIAADRDRVGAWRLSGGGAMFATGLGGTVTGRGADVLIIDDYLKSRDEAESLTTRDNIWDSFGHDFMTRLAPVHAVIIVANRWHEDDLVGRIQEANDPESDDHNPEFPVFDIVSFPAEKNGKWLFPERYDEKWYKTERAFAGTYGWNAQFQQDPSARKGNMLQVVEDVNVHIVDDIDELAGDEAVWEWGIDLASSEKELNKKDPDYTHGTLAYVRKGKSADGKRAVASLYIKDVFEMRKTAIERDEDITNSVTDSGASRTNVEVVGGYKDAYIYLKALLKGISKVNKVTVQKEQVARMTFFEPVFDAGNVYIQRAPWNKRLLHWYRVFPNGKHDDATASLLASAYKKLSGKGGFGLST